jgi:hypothetical protein
MGKRKHSRHRWFDNSPVGEASQSAGCPKFVLRPSCPPPEVLSQIDVYGRDPAALHVSIWLYWPARA